MKKFYALLSIFFLPLIAFATQITVPSAPSSGYCLVSTSTGAYVASSTICGGGGGGGTFSTTTINGLATTTFTFATTSNGTGFTISTSSIGVFFNLPFASASNDGQLLHTDWTTFNNKQNALTIGNLTSATPTLTVAGGTGAIIGSGVTLGIANGFTIPLLASTTQWANFINASTTLPTYVPYTGASGAVNLNNQNLTNVNNFAATNSSSTNLTVTTNLYNTALSNGCLNITGGLISSTGVACGAGGGSGTNWWTYDGTSLFNSTSSTPVGIGSSTPTATLAVQGSSTNSTRNIFVAASSTGTQILTVAANGNIGINSSTPTALLSVGGAIISGTLNATTSITIGSSTPKWSFTTDQNNSNAFTLFNCTDVACATVKDLFVTTGDNFTIGSSSAATKVTIAGNAYLPGGLYDGSNSLGTNGQCLTTTGVITAWGTCSSGSGTVNSGTAGYNAFYAANGTTVSGTSTIFTNPQGQVGVGAFSGVTAPIAPQSLTIFSSSTDIAFADSPGGLNITNGAKVNNAWNNLIFSAQDQTQVAAVDSQIFNQTTHLGGLTFSSRSATGYNRIMDLNNASVGIGTTTPLATLSVVGTGATPAFVIASSSGSTILYASVNGSVGIASSSPTALLTLSSTATTTIFIDSTSAIQGGCLAIKNSSGSGYTYVSANNGVLTASTGSCR